MSSPVIKGVDGVTEQRKTRMGTDGTGGMTIRTWLGPKAKIDTFAALNRQALGDDWEIAPYGGGSRLTVRFAGATLSSASGGGDEVEVEWELIPQIIDKDIRSYPRWRDANVGEADNRIRAAWIKAADHYLDTDDESDLDRYGPQDDLPAPEWVWQYIRLRQLGTETYQAAWYVLRVTETVSSASGKKASVEDDWTTITSSPIDRHPVNPQSRISKPKFDIPTTVGTPPQTIRWLIRPAEVRVRGRKRISITREYWGAETWLTEKELPTFAEAP